MGALALAAIGCGGMNDGDNGQSANGANGDTVNGEGSALTSRSRSIRFRPSNPPNGSTPAPAVAAAPDGGVTSPIASATPAAPSPEPAATPTTAEIIAAAETPDGTAIPQGAGPNGACPEVLVIIGFWSCPQLGQRCSFQSSGAAHSCLCNRLDGEGGSPAWVCDQ
jgi:hypothetical protein